MFYTYIIESINYGEWYVGYTNDLKRRLEEHNQGLNKSTKKCLPWKIVYYEACLESKDATRREGYLKTTQGRRMIKMRLKEYLIKNKI